MAILVRDILNGREPSTEEEWREAEREHNENWRYDREAEAYKDAASLFTYAGIPRSLPSRMIKQQMREACRAERELYWDEPAPLTPSFQQTSYRRRRFLCPLRGQRSNGAGSREHWRAIGSFKLTDYRLDGSTLPT